MKKSVHTFVLSFLLLIALSLTSIIPADAATYRETLLPSTDNTELLYGPPQPQQIPTLASRGSAELEVKATEQIKEVLKVVPETLSYHVRAGDSLYDLAARFNITMNELSRLNNISEPHLLRIGQKLQIPNRDRKEIETGYTIKQVLSSDLTAYTAGPESTGKSPGHPAYGITASGKRVKDYHTIATDPSVIPLGTKVYIEGIGIRVAEDTGGAIIGSRIDVYMNNLSDAINFGYKRSVKVYILEDAKSS